MRRATWLALGTILGALVPAYLGPPATDLVVGCLVAGGAGVWLLHRHEVGRAAFAFGAAVVLARAATGALLAPTIAGLPTAAATGASQVDAGTHEARVLSLSAPAAGLQHAVVELRPPDANDRVYVTLPRYPSVVPTDIIRFKSPLEPAPTDPGFGEFLARSGIPFTARPREMERVGADGSPLAALEQIRRGAAAAIAAGLPEPQAGLASAMSIGLRDLVTRDISNDFRIAGLSHVVAISGWHIAMLGAVVSGLLGRLSRRNRSALVFASICAYTILAGASPSVLRAAVMASVVLLARESGRRGAAAPALALTVAGMLALDPATITDAGFQLSAVATAGLLLWAGPLHAWLASRLHKRTPGWLLEALGVSLAAQAATLPLVLYQFGSLSLVAPLANLMIAPLVAPAMLLTAVAFACGLLIGVGLPAIVLAPLTLIGSLGIGAMIEIAHFSASLPFASLTLPEPLNLVAAGIAAIPMVVILWRRRRNGPQNALPDPTAELLGRVRAHPDQSAPPPRSHPRRRLAAAALAGLAVLLVLINGARPDGRLNLSVLDVGQGDAILLEGPSGGRMLVDTGPDPDRLLAVLDQRIPVWDRRLDVVVVTHPHEDHIAGLAVLLDRYRVGQVFEPGMVGPGPGDMAYRRRMSELGRESHLLAAGDSVWLDGIRLAVDWPSPVTCHFGPLMEAPRSTTSRSSSTSGSASAGCSSPAMSSSRSTRSSWPRASKLRARRRSTSSRLRTTAVARRRRTPFWSSSGRVSPSSAPAGEIRTGTHRQRRSLAWWLAARGCFAPIPTEPWMSARMAPTWSPSPRAAELTPPRQHRRDRRRRRESASARSTLLSGLAGVEPTIGTMSIPSRTEAARILLDLRTPDRLLTHSSAVGEVAAFLAASISGRGGEINVALVEAAALLHDLDKALPATDPLKSLGHGDAGAAWLRDHDFEELAAAVGCHPVMRLADDDRYSGCIMLGGIEQRIVAYADKRALQDLVSLDARFDRWKTRFPKSSTNAIARERAKLLEQDVCAAAGIDPRDVERLAWVDEAMLAARQPAPDEAPA